MSSIYNDLDEEGDDVNGLVGSIPSFLLCVCFFCFPLPSSGRCCALWKKGLDDHEKAPFLHFFNAAMGRKELRSPVVLVNCTTTRFIIVMAVPGLSLAPQLNNHWRDLSWSALLYVLYHTRAHLQLRALGNVRFRSN